MKKSILLAVIMLTGFLAWAQQQKKLTKEESAKMTQDQRVVYENDRKSKQGKKDVKLKKKIRTAKKQDRKAARINEPKHRKAKKKPT
jgi:hypothetical protein